MMEIQNSSMETHPYRPFVPEGAGKLVLGSIPPWRFTFADSPAENRLKALKDGDIDFYYGSRSNRFWMIFSAVFKAGKLDSAEKIKVLLRREKIAMSDVVHRCRRIPARSALDQNLRDIQFNHGLREILAKNKSIKEILFTSSFVERIFYRSFSAAAEKDISRKCFILPDDGRRIRTAVLYSPSNMALRGIRMSKAFKLRSSQASSNYTANDFRIEQYRKFFTAG